MAMLGLDWVRPIIPVFTIMKAVYLLLMFDYFSWFLLAKAYTKHITQEIVNLDKNYVSSIFKHSWAVYTDNRSQFVNQIMNDYYKNCNIMYYKELISYLSSTRFFEKAV